MAYGRMLRELCALAALFFTLYAWSVLGSATIA